MAKMNITYTAPDLRADHIVAGILLERDYSRINRFRKAGPPAARIIFISAGEKRFARGDIDVDAWFERIPIIVGISCLSFFEHGHFVLDIC